MIRIWTVNSMSEGAESCIAVTPTGRSVRLTRHAVARYIERVDPRATAAQATEALVALVAGGRVRATPRHWMRQTQSEDGTRYLYHAETPGVCILVRGGSAITVLTRELIRGSDNRGRYEQHQHRERRDRRGERRQRSQRRGYSTRHQIVGRFRGQLSPSLLESIVGR